MRSWDSRDSICSDRTLASNSHAVRVWKSTGRGRSWWQDTSPHSRPSTTMDSDMEARVPMFRMYCRCTGDTLRRAAKLMSSGLPVIGFNGGSKGEG